MEKCVLSKRAIAWVLVLLVAVLQIPSFADSEFDDILHGSMWDLSRSQFKADYEAEYELIDLNPLKGLKASGTILDSYPADVYYVFGRDKGNYRGLSRIVYIVSREETNTEDKREACYQSMISKITDMLGKPLFSNDNVTSWRTEAYRVQLGKGRLTQYARTNEKKVVLAFYYPYNLPKPQTHFYIPMKKTTDVSSTSSTTSRVVSKSSSSSSSQKWGTYDLAYEKRASDYRIYWLINTKTKTVRSFVTNDYGVSYGHYTGDLTNGAIVSYADGSSEHIRYRYKLNEGNSKAIIIDEV